jgi:hypothetical protein
MPSESHLKMSRSVRRSRLGELNNLKINCKQQGALRSQQLADKRSYSIYVVT